MPATQINTKAERPLTNWTRYEDLTEDERAKFGLYVLAKQEGRDAIARKFAYLSQPGVRLPTGKDA